MRSTKEDVLSAVATIIVLALIAGVLTGACMLGDGLFTLVVTMDINKFFWKFVTGAILGLSCVWGLNAIFAGARAE